MTNVTEIMPEDVSEDLLQCTRKVFDNTATFTQGSYIEESNLNPIIKDGLILLM